MPGSDIDARAHPRIGRGLSFARRGALSVAAVLATVAVAACRSTGASDPTPVVQFKITPASGTYVAARPPAPTALASASAPASEARIALVARDTAFDQSALTAPSGSVTIAFSNKDGGVVHNVHVFDGREATGKSLGQTELSVGPSDQELKLDLAAGAYYFQCDAHPATMKGTLTVR
jgi:plastocyanin